MELSRCRRHSWPPLSASRATQQEEEEGEGGDEKSFKDATATRGEKGQERGGVAASATPGVTRKFSYMVAMSGGAGGAAAGAGGGQYCDQLVTSADSGLMVNSGAGEGVAGGAFDTPKVARKKAPSTAPSPAHAYAHAPARVLDDAGSSGAQSAGGQSVASARSARSTRSQQVGPDANIFPFF